MTSPISRDRLSGYRVSRGPDHTPMPCIFAVCMVVAGCTNDKPTLPSPAKDVTPPPQTQPVATQVSNPSTGTVPLPMSETEKIEALIAGIGELKGAVFIRNDVEHDGEAAAKHLRDKWEWKKKDIATARDFIRLAATGSTVSGKPYRIRFADGREIPSADYLSAELQRIESAPPGRHSPTDATEDR